MISILKHADSLQFCGSIRMKSVTNIGMKEMWYALLSLYIAGISLKKKEEDKTIFITKNIYAVGPLKTRYGLVLALRCEPSTYQPIRR